MLQQQAAGALSQPAARAPQARPAPQRPCPASPPSPDAQRAPPLAAHPASRGEWGGRVRPGQCGSPALLDGHPGRARRLRGGSGFAPAARGSGIVRSRGAARPPARPPPGPDSRPRLTSAALPGPGRCGPSRAPSCGDGREEGRARQEGGPGRWRRRRAERGPQGAPSPRAASVGPRIEELTR